MTGCSTDPENTEEKGFSSTFIDPYFGSNAQNISAVLDAMKNASINEYIHTYNGNKRVIISSTMPTAILDNKTASQFLDGVEPILSAVHADQMRSKLRKVFSVY
ncbi:MAG: hypothetical protein LBK47_09165 [Prevotellaceae bacterium]|nr:hypothetical protein [Prevotellaceae bacterium]